MKQIREIEMTAANMKILQASYDKAVKEKKETFESLGTEFVTDYAKYLLEFYKNNQIKKPKS